MRFYIVTLGCPKNEVDGEGIAQVLLAAGHEPVADAVEAEALIVNTCGFIDRAREESIAQLKQLATIKRRSRRREAGQRGKLLIATGCLSQRSPRELLSQIPELDGVLGTLRWAEIDELLNEVKGGGRPCWTGEERGREARPELRRLAHPPSAYLKIADGCDAPCAFCAIPSIKGAQRSRPAASIVAEARHLVGQGVKEIVLIAQDTTSYGRDLGERDGLANLLERLVEEVGDLPWLRLMYAYPAHVTDRLQEVIAEHRQIVKYLDLPLQHGHPATLSRMLRPLNGRQVVAKLREAIPEIALRTAFIVGFPGETEAEFRGLLAFMEEMKFDRAGVFLYSKEEGTKAAGMGPAVPERAKRSRYARAMKLQQSISFARHKELVGKVIDVLIETGPATLEGGRGETYGATGRSYRDAPEVDGMVYVRQPLPVGALARARVVEALPYDLIGEAIEGSST